MELIFMMRYFYIFFFQLSHVLKDPLVSTSVFLFCRMQYCISGISISVNTEGEMEQLQWGYSLFAGLEGRELHHNRPSGGDANSAQHAEASPGLTTRSSLSNHDEGLSVHSHCVHRCHGSYDRLKQTNKN